MTEKDKKLPKAPPSLNAKATAMQTEIDLYRRSEALYRVRARRKTVVALILVLVCLLAMIALLSMLLLAHYGKIEPLSSIFLYASAGAILVVVLVALGFLIGSRDDKTLASECERNAEERRGELAEVLRLIEEERRREEEANMRVTETLVPLPGRTSQKLAYALRMTSAVLSALSIPVAALAALRKERKKKK